MSGKFISLNRRVARSLNLYRMHLLPRSHVPPRFVEDSDVIVSGDLACQCRADFLPQQVPSFVAFSDQLKRA